MSQQVSEPPKDLFGQVVEATGLSAIIASAAVSRACIRAGVDPGALTRDSLAKVLPHLEQTIRLYMRVDPERHLRAIKALARGRPFPPPNA